MGLPERRTPQAEAAASAKHQGESLLNVLEEQHSSQSGRSSKQDRVWKTRSERHILTVYHPLSE